MIESEHHLIKPLNLAHSEVLRAVEEEDNQAKSGYKRVAWPPVSEERIVREFTPQPTSSTPQVAAAVQQQYRASSYDSSRHNQQQYHSRQQQPNYQVTNNVSGAPAYAHHQPQEQAPPQPEWVNRQPQQPPQPQQPEWVNRQPQQQQQPSQPEWFNRQQQQQQQAQPEWVTRQQQLQQPQPEWVHYQQQQQASIPPYQQYQQYPTEKPPVYPNHYNQRPQQEYDSYPFHPYNLPQPQHQSQPQSQPLDTQAPYNSYSQFQQQHQQPRHDVLSQDQLDQSPQVQALPHDYRGDSPGIIQLRKELPVTQQPAPVFTSQPAAVSFQGGSNMRGDMKWPPQEYKEAAARENEERRKLALGPVCRPRKVKRDYSSFFAKNAVNNHYPSYKVPPGTQHMLA